MRNQSGQKEREKGGGNHYGCVETSLLYLALSSLYIYFLIIEIFAKTNVSAIQRGTIPLKKNLVD